MKLEFDLKDMVKKLGRISGATNKNGKVLVEITNDSAKLLCEYSGVVMSTKLCRPSGEKAMFRTPCKFLLSAYELHKLLNAKKNDSYYFSFTDNEELHLQAGEDISAPKYVEDDPIQMSVADMGTSKTEFDIKLDEIIDNDFDFYFYDHLDYDNSVDSFNFIQTIKSLCNSSKSENKGKIYITENYCYKYTVHPKELVGFKPEISMEIWNDNKVNIVLHKVKMGAFKNPFLITQETGFIISKLIDTARLGEIIQFKFIADRLILYFDQWQLIVPIILIDNDRIKLPLDSNGLEAKKQSQKLRKFAISYVKIKDFIDGISFIDKKIEDKEPIVNVILHHDRITIETRNTSIKAKYTSAKYEVTKEGKPASNITEAYAVSINIGELKKIVRCKYSSILVVSLLKDGNKNYLFVNDIRNTIEFANLYEEIKIPFIDYCPKNTEIENRQNKVVPLSSFGKVS